jgi:DUF1707 SHOCT-like domain
VARDGGTALRNADRDASAARLREHDAAGRLSLDEFQERLDAVYPAQTVRELGVLTEIPPREGVVLLPGAAPWGSHLGGYPLNPAKMRTAVARAGRRIMLAFGVVAAGSLVVLTLLIAAFVVHGGLVGVVMGALLAILAVGLAAVAAPRLDRGGVAGRRTAVAEPGRVDSPPAVHWPCPLAAAYPPGIPRLTTFDDHHLGGSAGSGSIPPH